MSRIADAKEALAVQRKADAVVDKMLGTLAEQDDAVAELVLSRLVALLQGKGPLTGGESPALDIPPMKISGPTGKVVALVSTINELPASVYAGARHWKRASGLPEAAICEHVCTWLAQRDEVVVADAFGAMMNERPAHELSFLRERLG